MSTRSYRDPTVEAAISNILREERMKEQLRKREERRMHSHYCARTSAGKNRSGGSCQRSQGDTMREHSLQKTVPAVRKQSKTAA